MGRLILLLSVLALLWAAGMPPGWIAFLLAGSLAAAALWLLIASRRRGRVVARSYHMMIDGVPLEDGDEVDRPPVHDSAVSGVMVEEYASGELRAFTIDRKIVLASADPMIVEVLTSGTTFRTGRYLGTTKIVIKAKHPRYAPIPYAGTVIEVFHVTVVPGPPAQIEIRMAGPPEPAR